ncbi:WD40 repeat domain-containing serine/threonine protein kinase [Phycisphaerales bacterium AB-hyl4]|uniref:WD40 repeat domain-containing serine/threonine protein kinase n=1 Tax=Natronomicrosphaera hydrolytica TaxID=3242702 RepID=A0ABV4U8C4_9BACT
MANAHNHPLDLPISADDVVTDATSPGSPATAPHLDGFQVRKLIGQGGMGTVWSAVQLSTGRQVALKLMRGGAFGSIQARARFDREIELLARLDHPNIAKLYQSGTHDGLYFYAMELVDGVPLNQYMSDGNLPLREQLQLMEKVCRAVDHAHRRGVIHRDLKPGNILVTSAGEPKVVDFGLAKHTSNETAGLASAVTREGAVAGTLVYMSPEQAAGELSSIDTRTDVYSLGVMLYERVTGQLPHPPGTSPYELQHRIINVRPPSPRRCTPHVDRDLEAIILKAMRRDPGERYTTAAELADDLQRYQVGDPLRARPLTLAYVVRKRIAQHKVRVVTAMLLLMLLLSAASFAYVRVAVERDRAEASALRTERTLYQHRLLMAKSEIDNGQVGRAIELLDACPEPLRHWEWRHLRRQADSSDHTIEVSGTRLAAMAVDSIQGIIRTVTAEGRLEAWNTATGTPASPIERWIDDAELAVFNQAGHTLLIYRRGQLELVDARDGAQLQTLPWEGPLPQQIAGSRDGSLWAVADHQNRLSLIDIVNGRVAWTTQLPVYCSALAFNSRDDLVVAAGNRVAWLMSPSEPPAEMMWLMGDEDETRIDRITFNPDGDKLATFNRGRVVRVWQRGKRTPLSEFSINATSPVTAMVFDVSSDHLIVAAPNGSLRSWDWRTGRLTNIRRGHERVTRWLVVCPEQRTLVAGDAWKTVKLWDLPGGTGHPQVVPLSAIDSLSLLQLEHVGGNTLVAALDTEGTAVWRLTQGGLELVASGFPRAAAAAFGASGTQIALADASTVHVWPLDLPSQERTPIRTMAFANVGKLAFCPEDQYIVAAAPDEIRAWPIRSTGRPVRLDASPPAKFDESGRLFTRVGDGNTKIVVWDLASPARAKEFAMPQPAHLLAVSPDGSRIAASFSDGTIRLWRSDTPEQIMHWSAYGGLPIGNLCFTPDGQRLVTAGPSIKVWDVDTADELLKLEAGVPPNLNYITFDHADQAIVAGSLNHIIRWSNR